VAKDTSLLEAIQEIGLPVSQACEGAALCGFCRVQVVSGGENLTATTDDESSVLAALHADENERLACSARVLGPVTITTDYW
jgi:ferredoxin